MSSVPENRERKALADRAAEIYAKGGVTYTEAVDKALAEKNPTNNATIGERLLYALLNVEEPAPQRNRPSPRGKVRLPDPDAIPGGPAAARPGPDAPEDPTHG
jgi:hypothetical protein